MGFKNHECVLCGKVGRAVRVSGKWYCDKHYKRWQTTGKFSLDQTSCVYEADGYAVIRTRKGDEFKIDSSDVEKCKHLTDDGECTFDFAANKGEPWCWQWRGVQEVE